MSPEPSHTVTFWVNGRQCSFTLEPRTLLVHLLRDECGLTGTKIGCDTSQCGTCTVLVDGKALKSCTVLAVRLRNAEVTTIEGLGRDGDLHPLQETFVSHHGFQCGYCTPGMIMASVDLLNRERQPDVLTIRRALTGNLCRCTGYHTIVEAVQAAAQWIQP